MGLVAEILQIVAPVFFLAMIGFGWVRLGLSYDVAFVTRLAMSLALPCLIFVALIRTEIDPIALRDTAVATLLAHAGIGLAMAGVVLALRLRASLFWAPMTFGNTGNIGLPLALFAFGAEGLDFAVVVFAISVMLSFTVGLWVVSGHSSPMRVLREPLVWATFAGGVFLVLGWRLPLWAENTLDLIGQMGIPLMLVTLGVALSRLSTRGAGRAVGLSVVKYGLCLGIAYAVGWWMALPPVALAVLVVEMTTPVAVTSYLLAQKYGSDAEEVAGLVVVSTLLSVLAMPLTLALFI